MLPLKTLANFGFSEKIIAKNGCKMSRNALIVDLYELTMAAGYFEQNYNPTVTFELFIRDLPEKRNYLIAAGLQQVVDYLLELSFDEDQIAYLQALPNFRNVSQTFFDYLKHFRFSGNMYAVPEGTPLFPGEPVIQIEAPLIEAQIVETFLLTSINFQTMVASKAARVVYAATLDGKERGVMEFGSRRAHGPGASVLAARATYLAGFMGTSNVQAGHQFGIPVLGTTAHSWTMAFEDEKKAFQKYTEVFGKDATFLIDTYDTVQGVKNAMAVSPAFKAVRIDSGDLSEEAKKIRRILDQNGYQNVKIILSSDLNEYKIEDMIRKRTPVDFFGVGTQVATSFDAPALQGVYKLVEIKETDKTEYRAKFSRNKVTLPGRKQVWRYTENNGTFSHDLISGKEEDFSAQAYPLIQQYIKYGQLVRSLPQLEETRQSVRKLLSNLKPEILDLRRKSHYPVKISKELEQLLNHLKEEMVRKNGGKS